MIVPCPVFRWERECENCGATIEVYYPPDAAFDLGYGNVKEVYVRGVEEGLKYAHRVTTIDGVSLIIANVCPLCETPIKEDDLYLELISMLFDGIDVSVKWVVFESDDDFCAWCCERLNEYRVAEISIFLAHSVHYFSLILPSFALDLGYLVQNIYSIIYHPLCEKCE